MAVAMALLMAQPAAVAVLRLLELMELLTELTRVAVAAQDHLLIHLGDLLPRLVKT
jgi:hypothetical protein